MTAKVNVHDLTQLAMYKSIAFSEAAILTNHPRLAIDTPL